VEYQPERDIPKCVETIKSLSPTAIVAWVRDNRTEKDGLGTKHQTDVTPQSVSMWFKRHPAIYQALERKLESELVTPETVSEDLFQNGFFDKLPCVEKWMNAMSAKGAKPKAIHNFVWGLKRICLGILPRTPEQKKAKLPHEHIEGWGIKHPARLTLDDCLKFHAELSKRNLRTHRYRLVIRNFLKSRNIEGWDTISGALENSGMYAHLYSPPEKVRAMFAWLKRVNAEAHDCAYFSFKTACRLTATLEADAKYVDKEQQTITVFEKASLHGEKRKQVKLLPTDLWELLQPRIERGGKLFNITNEELNGLLRACYREVIPELADEIPMPFHFWRHQFAQHGLRATAWNYGLVASLGHWTVETLERNYGRMDRQTALEQGRKFLPSL